LFACTKNDGPQNQFANFKSHVLNHWIYAEEMSEVKYEGELKKPVGFPFLVFKISYLNDASTNLETECFYFRAPYKSELGELSLIKLKEGPLCPEVSAAEDVIYKNIKSFKITNKKFELDFDIDGKLISLPLYNISHVSIPERFKPEIQNKLLNGFRLINLSAEESGTKNNYIGSYNQRYSLNTAILCKKVNDKCEVIGEEFCHRCKFGSFGVEDYECPNGGSRYCGINHCGEKGEPACKRGASTKEDSNDGICNIGLATARDKNNVLICQ
jgi:hypothetical protein